MTVLRRLLLPAVVLLMLASGAPVARAQGTPEGFKTVRVPSAGVSLAYPRAWSVVALTPAVVKANRKLAVQSNPQLGSLFDEARSTASLKHAKFAAPDLEAKLAGRASPIVQVQSSGGFDRPLDKMVPLVVKAYEDAGVTVVGQSDLQVAGTRAARIDLRLSANAADGSVVNVRMAQVLVPLDGRSVVVTAAVNDDEPGVAVLDRIIESIRPL